MREILSVENMRKSDANTIATRVSGRELMMRAGRAVYENTDWKPPVAIVCGSGNNAGDGYVIAKLLHDNGTDCTIILLEEKFSEDGRYYYDICVQSGIPVEIWETGLSRYSTIVECIFGTGFRGSIKGKAADVIGAINHSGAYVVSVDINSGLNGDTGMAGLFSDYADGTENPAADVSAGGSTDRASFGGRSVPEYGCVISDLTVSIGSFKPGHFLNMAKDVMKRKVNCDIGIEPVDPPFYLLEKADLEPFFKKRKEYSNKGDYGYIALIGGSKRYSGAIRLAAMANAAMRAGAGVVKIAVPDLLYSTVAPQILESTVFPLSDNDGELVFSEKEFAELTKNVKTVAFGMGIGVTEETGRALRYLLANYNGRMIIDADGLTLLSKTEPDLIKNTGAQLILTPHIKEFSRLTGMTIEEILASPIETSRQYASENGVILLLKGPSTIITDGNTVLITDAGCSGMATAGSGDVLSGILAAVCAYLPGEIAGHCRDCINGWLPVTTGDIDDAGSSRYCGSRELLLSVAAGAYINGRAGELAQGRTNSISMIAGDTVSCIADTVSELI